MKKNILMLMLAGLTLTATTPVLGKEKVILRSRSKNISSRARYYTSKKNGPIAKYSIAELTKNIEYDFAKSSVRMIYNDKLNQLAEVVIQNKSALTLRGYADSIGSYKGNWLISDKRANAVKNYLVTKGVDANKIVATPFGSTQPIASNKTKAGRQKNRRVEIKINDINN